MAPNNKKDKQSTTIMAKILKPFYDYYKFFNLNKVLSVKGISKDGVHIFGQPEEKEILYVLKLESNNNYFESLEIQELKTALRHSKDSQFTYYFIKNSNFQAGYIATFSKEVAIAISDKMGIELLSPSEVIQFLLDIYKVTEYHQNEKTLTVEPTVNAYKLDKTKIIDAMQYNLMTILKEGAFNIDKKYKLFQVVQYTNKQDFNYIKDFRKDFDGILQMAVDLSDAGTNYKISDSIRYANILDREKAPEFKKLYEVSKLGKLNSVVVNTTILSTSEREAQNTAGSLGVEIIEKKMDKMPIISTSFMLTRELDYDALLPTSYIENLIGIRTKKTLKEKDVKALSADKPWVDIKIDFNGRDLFNAPTNYCFRANENPHSVLIADAGTGKSVAIQKILKTILRYNIEENTIDRFKEVKVRYFEIGGSSAKFLNAIKELFPNDVGIINGVKDAMKFSLTDIKVVGETETNTISKIDTPILESESLSIAVYLMSVILEETREEPLSSPEEGVFNRAIKDVYRNKKYRYKTVGEIKKMGEKAYEDIIEKIYEAGYDDSARMDEIEGVAGIGKLQKPTIEDVMANIKKKSNATEMNAVDKETHDSLYKKLRAISETKQRMFGALSSLDFNNKQFYSFEFNQIKEDPELLRIIFTFLFAMVYRQDIEYAQRMKAEGGIMPQLIYIFEESKNFVYGNASVTRMMEKTVFEGRKFQIHAIFVAQQVEHIPMNIINGCSTFMFLMPLSKEKKIALKRDIMNMYEGQDTVKYLIENIPFRTLGIISSSGVSACKLELTKNELEMFAN